MCGSERDGDSAQAPALPGVISAESSCATTKAIEVCVNGVKQVIIVPLALSSDNVTTTSSTAFQPGCLPSVPSPAIGNVPFDNRPDDVKLLAQACIQATSSSVSSLGKPAMFSPTTSGQPHVAAGFRNHTASPPPFQLSALTNVQFASSLSGVSQNSCVPVTREFYVNSVDNRATVASGNFMSFQTVPSFSTAVLPVHGFPPACHSGNTVPLPSASQQPFLFPPNRNTFVPGQVHPGWNSLRHLLPTAVSQGPWTSYAPVPVPPPFGRNNLAMSAVNTNNYLLQGSTVIPAHHQPAFDLPTLNRPGTDYRQFLPSLQRAITAGLPRTHASAHYQEYLFRKRGALPTYNFVHGYQRNASNIDSIPHYNQVPQFDPRVFASHGITSQRSTLSENGLQKSYPTCSSSVISSYLSSLNSNSGSSAKTKGVKKHTAVSTSLSVSNNKYITGLMSSTSQNKMSAACWHPLNSSISHSTASTACQMTANDAIFTIPNPTMVLQNNTDTSCCRAVAGVPTDLQVTVNVTRSASLHVMAAASLPLTTVPTYVTETTCHPVVVTQSSASVELTSAENLMVRTLRFNTGSSHAFTSLPSNCSSAANPCLSELLTTPDSVTNLSLAVTESEAVTQTSADLDVGTGQSGDNSNDLKSLPVDVMVETSESESLLMSFCNMFEQTDAADATGQCSVPVSSVVPSYEVGNCSVSGGRQEQSNAPRVSHENAERGLQFAKSLGKGRHFAAGMEQGRRKQRLTSLEDADESNSSDSWHPDSHSESSDCRTPSISSPAPSTTSSVSQSSDDFLVASLRNERRNQQPMTYGKRKRSSRHVKHSGQKRGKAAVCNSAPAVTQKCTVLLERLQMQGRRSVNVRIVDSLICCPRHRSRKPAKRILSSDSECSTADCQVSKNIRLKVPHIEDSESSW